MKVLYIGNYNDGTGWANAAKNNILAMHNANINVIPRCITYNNAKNSKNEIISNLEKQSSLGSDICIQHVLPPLYCYNSNMKNIGYLAVETLSFKDSGWHKYCNMMDEIWVPSNFAKESCINSGIIKPIKVIQHCIDIDKYKKHKTTNQIEELKYTFNFAFVGEFIERKNIEALIRAFHKEFHHSEPVNLFIKTSGSTLEQIQNYCNKIKNGLKLRKKYKQEIVINGMLSFDDYLSVLKQCHYFVMPSRGEGFCIPMLESMSIGIPSIYTGNIGMEDVFIGKSVKSKVSPCFGAMSSLENLYTADSNWMEIDIEDLGRNMRLAFLEANSEKYKQLKQDCLSLSENFSLEMIGRKIKETINDL